LTNFVKLGLSSCSQKIETYNSKHILMTPIIFFLALLGGGMLAILALYFVYFALIHFQPGKGKIKNDLKKMKNEIAPFIEKLIPWNKEELELLSSTQVKQKVSKGIITTAEGVFNSIYHEPLIAYSYKKYISSKKDEVIYARTSNHEFVYRTKKGSTELFIDNQKVGVINDQGLLYGGRKKRLLARINKSENELELPIIIGDKERGTLMKPESGSINPRAFQFVGEMKKNEEAVFLSLAVLELVRDSVDR